MCRLCFNLTFFVVCTLLPAARVLLAANVNSIGSDMPVPCLSVAFDDRYEIVSICGSLADEIEEPGTLIGGSILTCIGRMTEIGWLSHSGAVSGQLADLVRGSDLPRCVLVDGQRWSRLLATVASDGPYLQLILSPAAPVSSWGIPSMLQAIIDELPATISIKDRDRRYRFINRTWSRMYGVSNAEIIGRRLEDVILGEDGPAITKEHVDQVRSLDEEVIADRTQNLDCEETFAAPDGSIRTLLSSKIPFHDDQTGDWFVLTLTHDITERKHSETLLEQAKLEAESASNTKTTFLSIVSHELRTPLNAIIGFAQLGQERAEDALVKDYLREVEFSGRHLNHLIDDILDLSQAELGRFELMPEPTGIKDMMTETERLIASEVAQKNLALTVSISPSVPDVVIVDPVRVRQVLLNLIGNAVKFTAEGRIDVHVEPWGREARSGLRFVVIDTGIGVPADARERIFEAFTQLEDSYQRGYSGLGLGLAICHRLVSQMGGSIGVDPNSVSGSRFWFTVSAPALRRATQAPA